MASSGSYAFNLDVDEIIREATELAGGEVTTGNEVKSAKRSLNLLLTDWQNRSINLWTVDTSTIDLTVSVTSFSMDSSNIDILNAVVSRDGSDLGISRISMEEYLNISNKSQTGRPNQYAVRRGVNSIEVFLYPIPENSTDSLKVERIRKIQDVNRTAVETVDVPTRFLPPLTAGLAYYVAQKRNNIDETKLARLKANYEELLQNAQNEDRERTSLLLKPSLKV